MSGVTAADEPAAGDTMDTIQKAVDTAVSDSTGTEVKANTDSKTIAYYFHSTHRCSSCRKIEAYSKEAIDSGFVEELRNGSLEFHAVNIDEPSNQHFIKDYQLYTKSLIITRLENGKQTEWKNLSRVWQLIRSKKKFLEYVQAEVRAYLEAE
jgi:hypothetical protein